MAVSTCTAERLTDAMKTIFKYPIEVTDRQIVRMPRGAQILSVQYQGKQLCIWAQVDDQEPLVDRVVLVCGTGHPMPEAPVGVFLHHIGTVQDGPYVWHVFERKMH